MTLYRKLVSVLTKQVGIHALSCFSSKCATTAKTFDDIVCKFNGAIFVVLKM